MLRRTCIVFASSLALAGCNLADKQEVQTDDSSNPHYKQAQQDLDNNNPQGAVSDYEAALAANPKLAGAHYELGIIYGDKLADPIGSIFHFKRYLELAPNSDKKDQVQALIDKQSQAFAASLPNSAAASADDTAKLQSENADLKKQVDDAAKTIGQLQAQLAKHHGHLASQQPPPASTPVADAPVPILNTPVALTDGTTAGTPAAAPATNVAPSGPLRATAVDTNAPDVNAMPPPGVAGTNAAPTGPSRSYTVVKGDSIWKIAHKMYPGDTKNGEDKILGANPGLDPKRLKPGQSLVVPQ